MGINLSRKYMQRNLLCYTVPVKKMPFSIFSELVYFGIRFTELFIEDLCYPTSVQL